MNLLDYLGAALLNSLWQAPLIALAGCLLLRAVPRASASTRSAVWIIASIGCVLFPLLTTPPDISLRIPNELLRIVEFVWMAGAAALLARTGLATLTLSRIKRVAYPLDVRAREGMTLWNNRGATYREVRLCVSDQVDVPVAIGLFDDLILLPDWLVAQAPADELDRMAMHELAHLRRYDDWTKLLQNVFTALLFFNPAVLWIGVQADVEREIACDDAVVQAESDALTYAASLTRMARAVSWASRFSLAPSLFAARRTISRRVERLLQRRFVSHTFSRAAATSYAAILLAAFFVLRTLTPIATQAITLPRDDGAVHAQVAALYDDLRRGRYHGENFGRAAAVLRQLGPATSLHIDRVMGGDMPAYLYGARTTHGEASVRVVTDHSGRIRAFTVNASGTTEAGRYLRAFMTSAVAAGAAATPEDTQNIALSTAIVQRIGDKLWPDWTQTPFAIDLLTADGPVAINFPRPLAPPSFPKNFEATFPLANGVPTIVIGEPQFAQASTPIRWSVTLLHEHFHQWQDSWPQYQAAVKALNLAPPGDTNAMWMLNYPFPYNDAKIGAAYGVMAHTLAHAVRAIGTKEFPKDASAYLLARQQFKAILKPDDYKYFAFQCWQEGTARYTEIMVARLAAAEHRRDPSFLSDADADALAQDSTVTYDRSLKRLETKNLSDDDRVNFYAFGAAEALLLDALKPGWRLHYLALPLDLGSRMS